MSASPPRVALLVTDDAGGMRHYADLLRKGIGSRVDVHTFVVDFYGFAQRNPLADATTFALRRRRFDRHLYDGLAAHLIERVRPDVVHYTSSFYVMSPLAARLRQHGIAQVVTVHDVVRHEEKRTLLERLSTGYHYVDFVRTMRHVSMAHVHSRADIDVLRAYPGVGEVPFYVAPHGCDVPEAVAAGTQRPPELPAAAAGDLPSVVFFGRIEPYKGLQTLVAALTQLRRAGTRVRLLLAGSGTIDADLKPLGDDVVVMNRFIDEGEVRTIFEAADCVVLPYDSATHSGVAAMALALGKPVIATRVGSLGEFVRDGVNGLTVPSRDPAALAAAIDGLLGDRERLARMGAEAARVARGELSWRAIGGCHVDAYEALRRQAAAA